jgi:hypothetical protein
MQAQGFLVVASSWHLATHEFPHFVRFMACEESMYKEDLISSDVSPVTLVASIGGSCAVIDARSDGSTRAALTEGAAVCVRNGAEWTVLRSAQGVEYFEGGTADAVLICADGPMVDAYWASNSSPDEAHPALTAILTEPCVDGKRFWRMEQTR